MSGSVRRNIRTKEYKKLLEKLPQRAVDLADKAYRLFLVAPSHPSLTHHQLTDTKKGQHRRGSCAVHIGTQWCAIYVPDGDVNVWYWVGTHESYNNFTGLK